MGSRAAKGVLKGPPDGARVCSPSAIRHRLRGRGIMTDPHAGQPIDRAGAALDDATVAVVMIHGRGATARSILGLADEFDRPDVAYLAPRAARNEWYPNPFLAPVESNEPGRTSALAAIGRAIETATDASVPQANVMVLGFSQGACLAAEYVAREPVRYGGIVALSGGLIGETIDPDAYRGDLAGTPAFLGCSDVDPHIPEERVHVTADVLEGLGADVTTRIYEGMGHGINGDEVSHVAGMLDRIDADE